jgi:hypothetical protein
MSSFAFVTGGTFGPYAVGLVEARGLIGIAEEIRQGRASWTAARPLGALVYKVQRAPLAGGELRDPDTGPYGDAHSQAVWAHAELFAARAASPVDEVGEAWATARLAHLNHVTRTPWIEAPLYQGGLLGRLKVAPTVLSHLVSGYGFTSGLTGFKGGYTYVLWRFGSPVAACVIRRREPRPDRARFTILVRYSCRQSDVRILADYLDLQGLADCAAHAREYAHEAPVLA